MPSQMLLEVENVTKKFGGLVALDQVSLNIQAGEIWGLIGPNGAGKSTLLNVIAGVHRPTSGVVRFQGRKISGLASEQICQLGISRTFQICRPFTKMTVRENVLVAAVFGNRKRPKNPLAWADRMLELVEFPLAPDTPASSLNAALMRRMDLARALASQPSLVLLDESAAGLTPNELLDLENLILKIRQQGVSFLVVEHLMRLIMNLCDRIAVLHYGSKIADGTPLEIRSDEAVGAAYLGDEVVDGL